MKTPKFKRIAAGEYETADGVFRLIKLDGGKTQAWNIEWTTAFECDVANWDYCNDAGYPVDGARTKADALYLFDLWYQENGHPNTNWRKA